MRIPATLLAAISLAFASAAARAQTPSIPPAPRPWRPPGNFTWVDGYYGFSGCARGPVDFSPATGPVIGTAFCLNGLLTVARGTAESAVPDGLEGVLQYAVAGDARIETPYADEWSTQVVTGQYVGEPCDWGCPYPLRFLGIGALGAHGAQTFFAVTTGPTLAGRTFRPDSITVRLGYERPDGSGFGRVTAHFALSTVPEPSTFGLVAAGALGTLGVWRRRRR